MSDLSPHIHSLALSAFSEDRPLFDGVAARGSALAACPSAKPLPPAAGGWGPAPGGSGGLVHPAGCSLICVCACMMRNAICVPNA